jgi:hypothetical protein
MEPAGHCKTEQVPREEQRLIKAGMPAKVESNLQGRKCDAQPKIPCICFFDLCRDVWLFDAVANQAQGNSARRLRCSHSINT